MGSPVSVVVAEIVMQHVEERPLATCRQTIPLWLRYWQTRPHCCGYIVAHDVSWAAQTGKHLLRTQNVSEQNQTFFCVPDTKFVSATNVARAGKRGNICVGNNLSATMCPRLPGPLRYVDDTFTAVHKDKIDAFHDHFNEQNADIQFTKEIEENGKLPFLDCLVSRDNNELRTTVYRKLTHTDRLLDESSYNPTSHKATTMKTLTRRAKLVCDTPDSLRDENKYTLNVFLSKTTTLTLLDETFSGLLKLTQRTRTGHLLLLTIPYIKGTSETISRILQPYSIRVAHKPIPLRYGP